MRVLFVTSEVYPLIKTGGLADVSGALPPALQQLGLDVRVLVPGYPQVMAKAQPDGAAWEISNPVGTMRARIIPARCGSLELYVLDAPELFQRPGGPYNTPDGQDWPDNHLRFGCLSWVAAWMSSAECPIGWRPDILHGHDWQAGLALAYARQLDNRHRPGLVFTIHNLAYQGLFPASTIDELRLPRTWMRPAGLEFWGQLGFLKSGLWYADKITTVSPTYAREIRDTGEGYGLQGLLQGRAADLSGILNGIDLTEWNPQTDRFLPVSYSAANLAGKAANKIAIQVALGLEPNPTAPLFGVVSRLTAQKGLDLLMQAVPGLLSQGGQLAIIGTGDKHLEQTVEGLVRSYRHRVGARLSYDEGLSHLLVSGCDFIMVPSRFEPCGLTQMYGLRYGTLPVVRRTGGLADTVVDATPAAIQQDSATGIVFNDADIGGISSGVERACALYRDKAAFAKVQQRAMAQDNSWSGSALAYRDLYRSIR